MNGPTILNAVGGLALFLLAMLMMTEGLKVYAGGGLKHLLRRWTSTPFRGVLSGVVVTGLVQSSSAVTVTAIGFVNAGLLNLRQALSVIFGTNVGTTMTGWLVSLVGFGFKIDTFALPILSIGVVLRLIASSRRYQGLGEALAGFGLFFIGLSLLKEAFGGLPDAYGSILAVGAANRFGFLLAGFVATVLTQSSSAAIAIILTAATGDAVSIEAAAYAVIGANIGTTSTAIVAVMKATPAAKRLAMGHIVFNLITGIVALLLMPAMLWLVDLLADWFNVEGRPAAVLALFHTTFNMLGVAIMLPLSGRLAFFLEKMFRSSEEDMGRPRHLDDTLVAVPALAVPALREELARLRKIVTEIAKTALSGASSASDGKTKAVLTLSDAIVAFIGSVRTGTMPKDVAGELAETLLTARYLHEAARLAPYAFTVRLQIDVLEEPLAKERLRRFVVSALDLLDMASIATDASDWESKYAMALARFQNEYKRAKESLIVVSAEGRLSVSQTVALLDELSAMRRMVEQTMKGVRLLRNPGRSVEIGAETDLETMPEESTPQVES